MGQLLDNSETVNHGSYGVEDRASYLKLWRMVIVQAILDSVNKTSNGKHASALQWFEDEDFDMACELAGLSKGFVLDVLDACISSPNARAHGGKLGHQLTHVIMKGSESEPLSL